MKLTHFGTAADYGESLLGEAAMDMLLAASQFERIFGPPGGSSNRAPLGQFRSACPS